VLVVAGVAGGAGVLYQLRAAALARQDLTDQRVREVVARARGLLTGGWQAADPGKLTEAKGERRRAGGNARSGGGGAGGRAAARRCGRKPRRFTRTPLSDWSVPRKTVPCSERCWTWRPRRKPTPTPGRGRTGVSYWPSRARTSSTPPPSASGGWTWTPRQRT